MGGPQETEVHEFRLAMDNLRPGTNVLAAEVHQSETKSTDLHFALSLSTATTPAIQSLRALVMREADEFGQFLERAASILPVSLRAELGPTLLFACKSQENAASIPSSLAKDPDAWRVRRRLQRTLSRHAAADEAARTEYDLRMEETALDWPRIVELGTSLRLRGQASIAEELLRKKIESAGEVNENAAQLLIELGLDLDRDPVEIFDAFPKGTVYAGRGPIGDWMRTVRAMREEGVVRINCGGSGYTSPRGVSWAADRHFVAGRHYGRGSFTREIRGTEDDPPYRTDRWLRKSQRGSPLYRIPLPSGEYRVTLHFAEIHASTGSTGDRVFDVHLDDRLFLKDYNIFDEVGFDFAAQKLFDVRVTDGWLEVELVFQDPSPPPKISAIEIERVE